MSGLNGNNLIEKSHHLVWAKFTDFTAGELRLLEVYLSRINPRDPETSVVQFTLKEYCDFLGLKLDCRSLKAQVKHFINNAVEIPVPGEKDSFVLYPLFDEASARFDPETMGCVVTLSCNPKLQSVFFDIAESGYVRYRLRYTASMKSQYSILLYSILRELVGKGVKNPDINIDKLKEQLGVKEPSYNEYRYFRKRVLETAVNEINDLSDMRVTYDKVVHCHKVVSVKFNIKLKSTDKALEASASEVEPRALRDVPDSEKPVRKPRSAPYEDVDWESIIPDIEPEQCASIARSVVRRVKDEYPNIRQDKKKDAVVNIMQNAYERTVKGNPNVEIPTAYLKGVLKSSSLKDFASFDESYLK